MKNKKNIFFLLYLLLFTATAFGQKHTFRHFTVEEGLPSLSINQILQDQEGYIWFASDKGISRYNGYEFETFTIQDGLPANNIHELYADSQNRIWILTKNAPLSFYYNGAFYQIPSDQFYTPLSHGIQEGSDSTVWFNTEDGVYFYKNNELKRFNTDNKQFIQIDSKNRVWLFDEFNTNLHLREEKRNTIIPLDLDSMEFIAGGIYRWLDDGIYFKTINNLYFYKDSLVKVPSKSVRKLAEQYPPLIVNTRQIQAFNADFQLIDEYNHLENFRFQGAFKDKEGNLWFYTTGDGVYLLTKNARNALTYDTEHGLEDQKITAIISDKKDSTTFIGTFNGDFYIFRKGQPIRQLTIDNARFIRALAQTPTELFIASEQGLFIFNKKYLTNEQLDYRDNFALSGCKESPCSIERNGTNYLVRGIWGSVKDIFLEKDKLFIATSRGSWEMDLSDSTAFNLKILSKEAANSVAYQKGTTWFGTNEGLFFLNNRNLQKVMAKGKTTKRKIQDIQVGKNGMIWVGTDGFGVYAYKDGITKTVEETARDLVQNIYVDQKGLIWVATNNGLHRIKLQNFETFDYEIRTFKATDGLATNEINGLYHDDNRVLIGTNRGFTAINQQPLKKHSQQPPILIEQIKINGEPKKVSEKYRLKFRENNIDIEFVGLSYKSNAALTYYYKMEGLDKEWQTTTIRERSYQDLAAATYTFHIKVKDVEGVESEERMIKFVIRPPFWETWWFRVSSSLILAGLIIGFTQLRIRRFQRREEEKNQILQEKTQLQLKIAEEQAEINKINKELVQSKLETLQAQINPHFAYNALTSIQKFILTKNKREANKYLVKFARLMRQFLEASKEKRIPLKKEIDLLTLYIEMEQLRFKDKFTHEIVMDKSIDTTSVFIPSMLLQIYVENAINHGLVYKEGKGKLKLIIEKQEGLIRCRVWDDGIGRKKAQAIKKNSVGAYKGLGMKISQERLKFMNMVEDKKVRIDIRDDILGEGLGGTEVVVEFDI